MRWGFGMVSCFFMMILCDVCLLVCLLHCFACYALLYKEGYDTHTTTLFKNLYIIISSTTLYLVEKKAIKDYKGSYGSITASGKIKFVKEEGVVLVQEYSIVRSG